MPPVRTECPVGYATEPATKADVERWFDIGIEAKMTHLIIIRMQEEIGERPLFVSSHNDPKFIKKKYEQFHKCKIYEVYNLKMDKEAQINAKERCWNF